jgi:hypothetical protein
VDAITVSIRHNQHPAVSLLTKVSDCSSVLQAKNLFDVMYLFVLRHLAWRSFSLIQKLSP